LVVVDVALPRLLQGSEVRVSPVAVTTDAPPSAVLVTVGVALPRLLLSPCR
jgi:hypothetical protein